MTLDDVRAWIRARAEAREDGVLASVITCVAEELEREIGGTSRLQDEYLTVIDEAADVTRNIFERGPSLKPPRGGDRD